MADRSELDYRIRESGVTDDDKVFIEFDVRNDVVEGDGKELDAVPVVVINGEDYFRLEPKAVAPYGGYVDQFEADVGFGVHEVCVRDLNNP